MFRNIEKHRGFSVCVSHVRYAIPIGLCDWSNVTFRLISD